MPLIRACFLRGLLNTAYDTPRSFLSVALPLLPGDAVSVLRLLSAPTQNLKSKSGWPGTVFGT